MCSKNRKFFLDLGKEINSIRLIVLRKVEVIPEVFRRLGGLLGLAETSLNGRLSIRLVAFKAIQIFQNENKAL
jgi:hypothetical protein